MDAFYVATGFIIALVSKKWWHIPVVSAMVAVAFEVTRFLQDPNYFTGTVGSEPAFYFFWLYILFVSLMLCGFVFYGIKRWILKRRNKSKVDDKDGTRPTPLIDFDC